MTASKPKTVPVLRTDEAAEEFLAQDLSALDFRQFLPSAFEFARKEAQVNLRLPAVLLDAVKARVNQQGISTVNLGEFRAGLTKA
jgi:predicted DNA binding CopG/RHH family protein